MSSESGWTIETLRAHHEQRFKAMDTALELKSAELSRRLDILNHAHERAVEVQHTYVPREVFEKAIETLEQQFSDYKETTNRALVLREGVGRGADKTMGYIFAGVGAMLALISIAIVVGDVLTP